MNIDVLNTTTPYTVYVSNTSTLSGIGSSFLSLLSAFDLSVQTFPGCDTKDIKLPNGQVWAACNVGATIAYSGQAYPSNTAFTATQKAYLGAYYQWGRNVDVTNMGNIAGPIASASADTGTGFIYNAAANYDWLANAAQNDTLW